MLAAADDDAAVARVVYARVSCRNWNDSKHRLLSTCCPNALAMMGLCSHGSQAYQARALIDCLTTDYIGQRQHTKTTHENAIYIAHREQLLAAGVSVALGLIFTICHTSSTATTCLP